MKINIHYADCGPFGSLWFVGFDDDEGLGCYAKTPLEGLNDLLWQNDHNDERVAAVEAEIAKREVTGAPV